jgi:hypothetical protein
LLPIEDASLTVVPKAYHPVALYWISLHDSHAATDESIHLDPGLVERTDSLIGAAAKLSIPTIS